MRIKVKCQIVAVCVKEYIDARQYVAAAWGLALGAWGLGLGAFFHYSWSSMRFTLSIDTLDQGSVLEINQPSFQAITTDDQSIA